MWTITIIFKAFYQSHVTKRYQESDYKGIVPFVSGVKARFAY